jgi:hypothetical protein
MNGICEHCGRRGDSPFCRHPDWHLKALNELKCQPSESPWVPAVGDRIKKPKGYSFDGEVRVVAELIGDNGGGMLHIFSLSQLAPVNA